MASNCHRGVYAASLNKPGVNANKSSTSTEYLTTNLIDITHDVCRYYESVTDISGRSDEGENLMQGLYNVVNWMYTKDLPSDFDNGIMMGMIITAGALNIQDKFLLRLRQHICRTPGLFSKTRRPSVDQIVFSDSEYDLSGLAADLHG